MTLDKITQQKLQQAIMLSVDVESAFKLYAYRAIQHEDFLNRIDFLVTEYNKFRRSLSVDINGNPIEWQGFDSQKTEDNA